MIFSKPMLRAILRGQKTQTRRLCRYRDGRLVACTYREGRTYSLQAGRGQPGESDRILVRDVRKATVGDIDYEAARLEGFRTTVEFKAAWVRLHDKAWVAKRETTIAEDGVEEYEALDNDVLAARFDARHADTPVWVISFEVAGATRLLAARPPRTLVDPDTGLAVVDPETEHGYTHNPGQAMPDEPEAVDDETLKRFAEDARERFRGQPGRREEELRRRARTLAARLKQGSIAAGRAGVDVAAHLDQIERHLEQLERAREAA